MYLKDIRCEVCTSFIWCSTGTSEYGNGHLGLWLH